MKTKIHRSNVNVYYSNMCIENEIRNINTTIDLFEKLISNENIPFKEYIDNIKRIYNIEITNNDLLRISSIILCGHAKCVILNTDMILLLLGK